MTEHAAALKLIAAAIGLPGDASPMEIASDVISKLTGTRKNGMGTHLAKCSGFTSAHISDLLSGKKMPRPKGPANLSRPRVLPRSCGSSARLKSAGKPCMPGGSNAAPNPRRRNDCVTLCHASGQMPALWALAR